jgi:tetratricopeptide (TPR) repeat protein
VLVRTTGHTTVRASVIAIYLSDSLVPQDRAGEAEQILREVAEKTELETGDSIATVFAVYRLGLHYRNTDQDSEAERCFRQSREGFERHLGRDHTLAIHATFQLGVALRKQGKLDEAEVVLRESYDRWSDLIGADHPNTLQVLIPLARIHDARGNPTEAERLFREAVERNRRTRGDAHPSTLAAMNWLGGFFLLEHGRFEEAETVLQEALSLARQVFGEANPTTMLYLSNLSRVLAGQSRLEEAEALARAVLAYRRKRYGPVHNDTFFSTRVLAGILFEQDKIEDAVRWVDELAAACRANQEQRHTNAEKLGRMARNFLNADPPEFRSIDLALVAAGHAAEFSERRSPVVLNTLARAHHLNGDDTLAAVIQREAIDLLPSDAAERRATWEQRLTDYESSD